MIRRKIEFSILLIVCACNLYSNGEEIDQDIQRTISREVFKKADTNHDDKVTDKEFDAILDEMVSKHGQKAVKITKKQFEQALEPMGMDVVKIKEIWSALDKDKNDKLDVQEQKSIFNYIDADDTGSISLKELRQFFGIKKVKKEVKSESLPEEEKEPQKVDEDKDMIQAVAKRMDQDHSGGLTSIEIQLGLVKEVGQGGDVSLEKYQNFMKNFMDMEESRSAGVFHILDANQDGKLNEEDENPDLLLQLGLIDDPKQEISFSDLLFALNQWKEDKDIKKKRPTDEL